MDDGAAAIAYLDRTGRERALVTPWASALGDTLAADDAVAYARAMNEALAELVADSGGRLAALGILPTTAPERVADVFREAAALGLRGALLATHMGAEALDAPRFEAVWASAEELSLPVYLHPNDIAESRFSRLERFNLGNLIGNPVDTGIAAASLMFGGVLDRHPGLRVVLSHGGGTLPYGVGRLDHGFRVARGGPLGSRLRPSEYLRRFWYDAVVYRERTLAYLVETVGADRVMLGTDYPFDMEMPDANALVAATLDSPGDREAVLAGTARLLFDWA